MNDWVSLDGQSDDNMFCGMVNCWDWEAEKEVFFPFGASIGSSYDFTLHSSILLSTRINPTSTRWSDESFIW